LENLKFNFLYSLAYIYIYIVKFINVNKLLKIFSIQHYIHLEVVTYTYDVINNSLSIIFNSINSFYKDYINFLHPNADYRRKLPINKKLYNLYNIFYPIIYNHNYKNIKFYKINFYIIFNFLFLIFISLFKNIIKKIKLFKKLYNNNIFILNLFYFYKKNKNKDLFILFFSIFFLLVFINYNMLYLLFINLGIILFLLYINMDNIFYILGYIFIFIFDFIINIINKIYKILFFITKYTLIYIFIYLLYKITIVYFCNNIFLSFIFVNIKLDLLHIFFTYAE